MPHNTTLDTILASPAVGITYRVLTAGAVWPSGNPPYLDGAAADVPAIPTGDDVPVYDPAAFDAAVWTDVSALVSGYRYTSNLDQQTDVLSLSVPVGWDATDLHAVFQAMRTICIQQRLDGNGADTGWLTVAFCLSCGYARRWDAGQGAQQWTVNALDAMLIANLDVLGSASGSAVYQPDLVEVGGAAENDRATLAMVDDLADAWEFAITSDGEDDGPIHPNWADRPGPQFWCHNVPGADDPVPCAIAGDAVQAVFGEGRVRIGKHWARESPGDPANYAAGLGFDTETVPDIRCHLYRFAHPEISNDGQTVPSDVSDALTIIAHTTNTITVDADCSGYPLRLSLTLLDGSARRYAVASAETTGGQTTFTLSRALDATITDDVTTCRYGEANRATDTVYRLLTEAGYQTGDAGKPLHVSYPETPLLAGAALPIILPPLVYAVRDNVTRMEALEEWRRQYAVLPSWYTRATATGGIVTRTVQQLFDSATGPHADILPLSMVAAAEADHTDQRVFTRVWVEGRRRQIVDWTQAGGIAISEPTAANGGLPDVTDHVVTLGGAPLTLHGLATRTTATGNDYQFALTDLFDRGKASTLAGKGLRPWGWYWRPSYSSEEQARAYVSFFANTLVDAWRGKTLAEIDLGDTYTVGSIELAMHNTWMSDTSDWGGNRHSQPVRYITDGFGKPTYTRIADAYAWPQVLTVQYYDDDQQTWQALASNIEGPITSPLVKTLTAESFDTRAEVSTSKLRIVCNTPFYAICGFADENVFHSVAGAYLSQLKIWSGDTLVGMAELGDTAPFTGADWQAVHDRLRRRTYVVPDIADWAQTQAQVDALAKDWLFDVTRNLAPTPVTAIRPDARVGDTVRMYLPTGAAVSYGDTAGQLSDWRLFGVELANSDDLLLYWELVLDGDQVGITLFSDAALTHAVASGIRTGDGAILLTSAGYGITGSVTFTAAETPVEDTGTVAPATYLITDAEHGATGGQPGASRLVLVNYLEIGV